KRETDRNTSAQRLLGLPNRRRSCRPPASHKGAEPPAHVSLQAPLAWHFTTNAHAEATLRPYGSAAKFRRAFNLTPNHTDPPRFTCGLALTVQVDRGYRTRLVERHSPVSGGSWRARGESIGESGREDLSANEERGRAGSGEKPGPT